MIEQDYAKFKEKISEPLRDHSDVILTTIYVVFIVGVALIYIGWF